MKGVAISYPMSAFIAVCYWLLWFTPSTHKLLGPDGSMFFFIGFLILGATALQTILWALPSVRNIAYETSGKWLALSSIIIIALFFCWGAYIVAGIYIYGV